MTVSAPESIFIISKFSIFLKNKFDSVFVITLQVKQKFEDENIQDDLLTYIVKVYNYLGIIKTKIAG